MSSSSLSDTSSVAQSADPSEAEPDNPRLDNWINHTTLALDLIALFTIWLTIVPLGSIHRVATEPFFWYAGRIVISVIYGIDMGVRTYLSHRRWHYFVSHPVGVLAVVLPAIRLLFSLRLLKTMFKKGNTIRFLFVSIILLVNLMIIVWSFERTYPGANITTIGIAIWWGCVTVFTVGYGDYYPVTVAGRFFAVAIMVVGLTTAAVITAQIASSFMDQAQARRNAADASGTLAPEEGSPSGEIEDRLHRIELLLKNHFEGTSSDHDQT